MGCCQEVVDSLVQVGLDHIQSPGCIGLLYRYLYPLSASRLLEHAEEKVQDQLTAVYHCLGTVGLSMAPYRLLLEQILAFMSEEKEVLIPAVKYLEASTAEEVAPRYLVLMVEEVVALRI